MTYKMFYFTKIVPCFLMATLPHTEIGSLCVGPASSEGRLGMGRDAYSTTQIGVAMMLNYRRRSIFNMDLSLLYVACLALVHDIELNPGPQSDGELTSSLGVNYPCGQCGGRGVR